MSKRRVLFVIDTLEVGGAEKSILEIATRLNDWEPFVVSLYRGNSLQRNFENEGIKVFPLNIQAKYGWIQGYLKLLRLVKEILPDVIHATLFKSEQLSRMVGPRMGIPVINSFVNDGYSKEHFDLLNFTERLKLNGYKFIDRLTSFRVTKFMSITHAIIPNNSTALKVDPKSVEVIYRGRNIRKLRSMVDEKAIINLKTEFGEGPIVLTVSRLLRRKGYFEAIRAIEIIVREKPSLKYLIAGDGYDRKSLLKLIEELSLQDNVFLLGNRRDVPNLLSFCDLFLFPSHYEGQGGALVEAMIFGKPIIASKISVIEESVQDEFSALLFQPKDINEMSKKILWAIENMDTVKSYGANARAIAEEKFDIQEVARQHEKMYNIVLENYKNEKRKREKD